MHDEDTDTPEPRTELEHSCTGKGVGPFDAEGQYPPEEDWRQRGVVIGDVGFPDHEIFLDRSKANFGGAGGEYRAYGFAIVVAAGESATISIAKGKAAWNVDASDDGGDGRFSLSDGADPLQLTACDEEDTRFLEALIVGGAQCVRLRIAMDGGIQGVVDMPFATECV